LAWEVLPLIGRQQPIWVGLLSCRCTMTAHTTTALFRSSRRSKHGRWVICRLHDRDISLRVLLCLFHWGAIIANTAKGIRTKDPEKLIVGRQNHSSDTQLAIAGGYTDFFSSPGVQWLMLRHALTGQGSRFLRFPRTSAKIISWGKARPILARLPRTALSLRSAVHRGYCLGLGIPLLAGQAGILRPKLYSRTQPAAKSRPRSGPRPKTPAPTLHPGIVIEPSGSHWTCPMFTSAFRGYPSMSVSMRCRS